MATIVLYDQRDADERITTPGHQPHERCDSATLMTIDECDTKVDELSQLIIHIESQVEMSRLDESEGEEMDMRWLSRALTKLNYLKNERNMVERRRTRLIDEDRRQYKLENNLALQLLAVIRENEPDAYARCMEIRRIAVGGLPR